MTCLLQAQNAEQGNLNIEDKSSGEELPNFIQEDLDLSSEEDSSDFTLEQLEDEIKNNKIQDYRLRYVAQYLRLVEKGNSKVKPSRVLAESLNRGPWMSILIRSWASQFKKNGELVYIKLVFVIILNTRNYFGYS